MPARALRRQLLLSTTMIVGTLTGYGGRAYAACVNSGGSTYTCSGAETTTQTINAANADVSTVAGFSVTTATGNAVTITGDGALSYTDAYASPLTSGDADALYIHATGGSGNLIVNTNGTLVGGDNGISTVNEGTGETRITANGNVTGTAVDGISADNSATGTNLTVTTGAGTTVGGGRDGIRALNYGSGTLAITANGTVAGTNGNGIFAGNSSAGTDLTVTTGTGAITGDDVGIDARNNGNGATTITANGNVYGTSDEGINATNDASTTDLSITTAADTLVEGGTGINAANSGSGTTSVTAYGNVTGTGGAAISAAANVGSGSLTILTGTGATLLGDKTGISAINVGDGALSITTGGNVTGTNNEGIYASSDFGGFTGGTDMTITTGAGTTVSGTDGIYANNAGSGATSITANGNVYGTTNHGIAVKGYGSSIDVTTGADSTITGNSEGVFAQNFGSGPLAVTVNGDVDATTGVVTASNSSMDTTVTIGTGANVNGTYAGISSTNDGSGALRIEVNGYVNANLNADSRGIAASTYGANLDIVTGAGSTVTSSGHGIDAINNGNGHLSITANGNVTGTASYGIRARAFYGTSLTVTTGAGTTVSGGDYGIQANNDGSGATAVTVNGDVNSDGIGVQAQNDGTDVTVTVGAGSTVTAADQGIFSQNNGSGVQRVEVNGVLTSTSANGINAVNVTGAELDIVTGASSDVTGAKTGIAAFNAGSDATTVSVLGNVTGTDDGIFASYGPSISVTVGSGATVTSNGADGNDFAIETANSATSLKVEGTLNGGGGGAVQFDQTNPFTNSLELVTGASVTGNVVGGSGTDTLTLSGADTGAFNVGQLQNFEAIDLESGTWSLSGTTTADAQVNGGTLMGTGTFGDLTVNGGTVAPGNSIGTMTVNGAFTLAAGTIFEVETNAAGQSDKVIVNGTVNLTGAILRVLPENGNYKLSTDYVIIDNDGTDAVVGSFASITSSLAFLTPTVVYNDGTGNDVVLTLERNASDFCSVAKTRNQCNVATALDMFPTGNALYLAVLNQTAAGARQAFDALSGEIHATVGGVLLNDNRYVREAVLGRLVQATYTNNAGQAAALGANGPQVASLDSQAMALGFDGKSLAAPERAPLAFWTRAYGAWGNFDGDGNAATADRDLGGFVSGMDANIGGSWRAGLATGASFSNVDVDARYSSADVESYTLGGYVGGMASVLALRGGGLWAWSDIDTSRAVVFPGFFERQKASYDADTGQLFGEVAYPTQMLGMALEPFGGLAFVSIDTENFRGRGGSLSSLRGSVDQDVGYSTLGLRAATVTQWGGMAMTPNLSVAWLHAFDGVTPDARLVFATTGIGFTIYGVPLAEDSALIDAGLDFALGANTTAGVSYTGQFGDGVQDNGVKGRFTWLF